MPSRYEQLDFETFMSRTIRDRKCINDVLLFDYISRLNKHFYTYDRVNFSREVVIKNKFLMQHLRSVLYHHIGEKLKETIYPSVLFKALDSLNIQVHPKDQKTIRKIIKHKEFDIETKEVIYRLLNREGPRIKLNLIGNIRSKWTFERWSKISDFSNYRYQDGGVIYKNIHFFPGDVIPCNINLPGNGVYTTLSEPRNYSYHLGVFAIIERNGKPFPSVIETYELGVRAVPLSEFVTPRFNSYLEVFRHKEITPSHFSLINKAALEICNKTLGYNFDTEDPDRNYLSCTTVFTRLCELIDVEPVEAISVFTDQKIKENRDVVDYSYDKMLALIDFVVSRKLEFVGVIDNNQFATNLTRELIERGVRVLYQTKTKTEKKFPIMYFINLFGVRELRKNSSLGKVLGKIFGFSNVSLPKGPDKTLAIIEIVIHMMGKAEKIAIKKIKKLIDYSDILNIDQFQERPEVKKIVEVSLKGLDGFFR